MSILRIFSNGEDPESVWTKVNAFIEETRLVRREWSVPFDGTRCYFQGREYDLAQGGDPNGLPVGGDWIEVGVDRVVGPPQIDDGTRVWDNIVVGQPKLPISAFDEEEGFYEDFSGTLTDIFSTSPVQETRTGRFGNGFYAQSAKVGWGNNQYNAPAQINQETQFYRNAFGGDPDPLGLYEKRDGNLICKVRPTLEGEASTWAYMKGYYTLPDGGQASPDFFTPENGFNDGPPAGWEPVNEDRGGGNIVVRFEKLPSTHCATMFHTLGRYSSSFGRWEIRGRAPSGASGMGQNDRRLISAYFSALLWLLQDIEFGKDINGDTLADSTDMPANQAGESVLPEMDAHENFSESPTVAHQTMHWYGPFKQQNNRNTVTADVRTTRITYGVDVTPGRIGFFINDDYTHVMDTPDSIKDPLPIYEKRIDLPYLPVMVSDGNGGQIANIVGQRENPDGSPAYMKWFGISNTAVNGGFVRGFVDGSPGSAVPFVENAEAEIEYIMSAPLAVDNPDLYRVNTVYT